MHFNPGGFMISRNVFFNCVLTAAVMLTTSALAADAPQNLDALVLKSGLQKQIDQLPEVVKASFDDRAGQDARITPEEAGRIRLIITEAFNPAVLLESIKAHINSNMSADDIDAVLKWLDSDIGQKITKAEEDASSAEAYSQLMEFAMRLEANPPEQARAELIGRLDQAARMTEFSTGMKIDMILAMAEAMASTAAKGDFNKADMVAQVESSRGQIQQASAQEVLVSALFTYRPISDDEIQKYIDFYNSDAGKKYADVVTRGLLNALESSSKLMGEKLGVMINEVKESAAPAPVVQ